jgi:hypothetical protein
VRRLASFSIRALPRQVANDFERRSLSSISIDAVVKVATFNLLTTGMDTIA